MNQIKTFAKGFVAGFKSFGLTFSNGVNYVLLSAVYFFGVGFTSLTAKLLRKNFLDMSPAKRKSQWVDRKENTESLEDYYRQF